jgi:hypothetical protein
MGMPVKLSDDLVKLARKEAEDAERSLTAQIEHWARLGRSVETALRHDDALMLKRANGNLREAFTDASTRRAVLAVLQRFAETVDRAELARTLKEGRVVYQSDSGGSGRITRIGADGKREVGRIERRRFVASRPARKRIIDE